MPGQSHKLIHLVKSFSVEEISELKRFLASPIYTNGRNYLPLLNDIVKYNFDKTSGNKFHEIYAHLYPHKKFSSQTLKNRLSELFKLCEEFLVYQNLNSNAFEKEKILMQEYLFKKQYRLFDSKYRKNKKRIESLPDSDEKFRNISFLNEVNLHLLNKKSKLENMYNQFYDKAEYTVCLQLIELFQYRIEFFLQEYDNRKIEPNTINELLNGMQIEEMIKRFSKSKSKIHKVVCMFYFMYKAYENWEDENEYFKMKSLFSELRNFFSSDYKNEIYKSMISYCILRRNSGVKKFNYELFELYNEKLNDGLYDEFRIEMFPVNLFRDYVFIGIGLKKYEWVRNFVKKYSKELPESIREDEINLSYAKLYFEESQFEKALAHLSKVKKTNYLHYCDSSVLKLCCCFELNKYEDSFFQLDSFKHYLRNHTEIPKVHKIPNQNFTKIFAKLLTVTTQPEGNDFGYLRKLTNETPSLPKREWLMSKME